MDETSWSTRFVLDLTGPSPAKHATPDVSLEVTLLPPEPFDKVEDGYYVIIRNTDAGDRKTTYKVRRAAIFGGGASYYLGDDLGRGHVGVSADGDVVLFFYRKNEAVLRRITRLPIYRLLNVSTAIERDLVEA